MLRVRRHLCCCVADEFFFAAAAASTCPHHTRGRTLLRTHTHTCAHALLAFPRQTTSIHFARHHQFERDTDQQKNNATHIRKRSSMHVWPADETRQRNRSSLPSLALFHLQPSTGQIVHERCCGPTCSLFPTRKRGTFSLVRTGNDERVNTKKEKEKKA